MSGRPGPLAEYRARRDFARTPEPTGAVAAGGGNRFVVQKHAATRLHWDFRLEVDGVLKSWAVTRGPSLDPADRRLAVRTEDHPLGYADFEGVIPQGEYGGGTVMLWDRGTWEPVPGKSADDLAAGHLHFILHGERMKGEWLLVRMKGRPGEKRENWLLRKIADRWATGPGDDGAALVDRALTSVLTGRTMAAIAADPAAVQPLADTSDRAFAGRMAAAARHNARVGKRQRRTVPAAPPPFSGVQLATLVDAVPSGNGWMHEIKFDGYRALVAVAGADVHIYTRNGLDWTEKFAPLAASFAALRAPPALIDGEIVARGPDGNPSFSALQQLLKRGHGAQRADTPLDFFAFDLLFLDGEDLRPRPAIERKERLEALLGSAVPPIHVADHVLGGGEALFAAMCAAGQEGIIAKRIDAPYRAGRNRHWLKVKCGRRQEFVVVGWTESRRRGRRFASLLLADRAGDGLVYRGKVGTGFDADDFETLGAMLARLEAAAPPLDVPRAETRGAHWVRPELVAEIAFSELTADGHIRHGSFMGLRRDKPAASVEA